MSGVSEAYYHAISAIAAVLNVQPLPAGVSQAEVGDWSMTINGSNEAVIDEDGGDIGPWSIKAMNNKYLAFAILDPAGGAVGGMSEDQFIADMKAATGEVA